MGRHKKDDELHRKITEMYLAGASQKEIVEELGCSYCVVRYTLKRDGVFDSSRRVHNLTPAQAYNEEKKNEALTRFSFDLLQHGFAYVSGYKRKDSKCTVRCMTCGGLMEVTPEFKGYRCPLCIKDANEEKRMSKLVDRLLRDDLRDLRREEKEREEKEKKQKYTLPLTCKWCGCEFTLNEYMEREGVDNVQFASYCSSVCRKRSAYKYIREHYETKNTKRAKRAGVLIERGVTLSALIKRDGLRCAICGELCDVNDKSYGNGSGPRYPSVDHIIPLSKGGDHVWSNVQVAHIICNIKKGANVEEN